MKISVRITLEDGRTATHRRGFDVVPERGELDAVVSAALAELNYECAKAPARKKATRKKVATK